MKTKKVVCDVLVVGAGISGVAAGISASRSQAKTILIERNSSPGGIALDCQHEYICGLYPENTGIAKDIILALQKLNPKNRFTRMGKLLVFSFKPENLELILRKLMHKEKNLEVFYNCKLIQAKKRGNSLICLKAISKSLKLKLNFKPKVVIDASGQGVVIKLSKAKYQLAALKSRQLAGFTFGVRNLIKQSDLLAIKVPYYLSLAVQQKKIPAYFKFTNFVYDSTKNSGKIKLNLPAGSALLGIEEAKKYASLIHAYLRKVLPEFKNSQMYQVSLIQEREGLRLYGKHILTEREILAAKKFPDAVAKGYWPIEFWHLKNGQQIKYLKTNKFYDIPLGSLQSRNVSNLFATGKCISASSRALASSRVMGTCIYLGEAAGKAACLSSRQACLPVRQVTQ